MKVRVYYPAAARAFRRTIVAALTIVAVAISTGCSMLRAVNPLSTTMSVFNNSGRTVLVSNKEVAPGKKAKVDYVEGSRDRLFVFSAGCAFSFTNLPKPPDKFEAGSIFGSEYRAQLEGDGRIFLVLPGARRPVASTAHAEQPPGFPLTPSRGSGCQTEEPPPAPLPVATSPAPTAPAGAAPEKP